LFWHENSSGNICAQENISANQRDVSPVGFDSPFFKADLWVIQVSKTGEGKYRSRVLDKTDKSKTDR
jgi:hypothetical protein